MTTEDRFNYRQFRIIMELPTRALNNKYLEKIRIHLYGALPEEPG